MTDQILKIFFYVVFLFLPIALSVLLAFMARKKNKYKDEAKFCQRYNDQLSNELFLEKHNRSATSNDVLPSIKVMLIKDPHGYNHEQIVLDEKFIESYERIAEEDFVIHLPAYLFYMILEDMKKHSEENKGWSE